MSAIPSNLARVPNSLASMSLLGNLTRTNAQLLTLQTQMASGKAVNRPSDDVVGAAIALGLQDAMERRDQTLRNLDRGEAMLDTADGALAEAGGIALEARDIATSMVGLGGDEVTRRNQAEIVQTMLNEMLDLANAQYNGLHLFGGQQTGAPAFETLLGGFEYTGTREGLELDLGIDDLPVTLSGEQAFGALSARVEGDHDLDPSLTADTRVSNLNGAQGTGVAPGSVEIDVTAVGTITVDLSQADSVQDVIDLIDDAIVTLESDTGTTILGPGRVSLNSTNDGLGFDVAAGITLNFNEVGSGSTATDLGLTQSSFTDVAGDGADLDPRVSELTLLSDLTGVGALSNFVVRNMGQARTVDVSGVQTVEDLANAIDRAGIGVRLEISEDGSRLNLVSELSGGDMSVEETVGGSTATELGLRSFTYTTRLEDFNHGRGVEIRSGSVDPVTGLPDPSLDVDFRVTLSDGTTFDVSLVGAETVQDVIDIVTAAAPPTFTIDLTDGPNGFTLTDSSGGAGTFSVTALHGSRAAQDLGILGAASGATLAGEDHATIAVDSVFTHLVQLRDALLSNDERGIMFAGQALTGDVDRLTQARGVLGQRAGRVDAIRRREEDRQLLDAGLESQVRDLDYTEAAVRFNALQAQMQAAMIAGAQTSNLSLLNFLAV